jgi:3,4-dihydroxy 2-butanone 4-phosphate synthase/GTP cyclohydrolase II
MAQPGGVLTRAGHTEAGCDLARLAGFDPSAAIVEILNEDGTMARRPDLEKFARVHDIKIGTIVDLIRYRLEKEQNVERISQQVIATEHGEFTMVCYDDHVNRAVHVALVKGDLGATDAPLVRVHLQDTLGDVVGVQSRTLGWPLQNAIERISKEDAAVIVLLRDRESSRDFMDAVEALGQKADDLRERRSGDAVLRTYGVGAQILRDLGLSKIRVLSAPKHMHAISGFDLEITEYVEE